MTDATNDPIAASAAQLNDAAPSSADPSMLERAQETIHELESKIEHLIHPEAATTGETAAVTGAVYAPVAAQSSNRQSSESSPISAASTVVTEGEGGNVSPAASTSQGVTGAAGNVTTESPTSTNIEAKTDRGTGEIQAMTSAISEEVTHVVTGSKSAGDAIREHLAAVKKHLSARGFELSLVADIHAELAAIERLL